MPSAAEPLSPAVPADFVDLVIGRIQRQRGDLHVHATGDHLRLVGAGPTRLLNLHPLWRQVQSTRDVRPVDVTGTVDHWVRAALTTERPDPATLADQLRLVVRSEAVVAEVAQTGDVPVWQPLHGLAMVLAAELDDTLVLLTTARLAEAALTPEEAFDRAWGNTLDAMGDIEVHGKAPGMLTCGGLFEASLPVLTPALWDQLAQELGDEVVIGLPARDLLFFAPAHDDDAVDELRTHVRDAHERGMPHLLTDRLYVRREGAWQVFAGPAPAAIDDVRLTSMPHAAVPHGALAQEHLPGIVTTVRDDDGRFVDLDHHRVAQLGVRGLFQALLTHRVQGSTPQLTHIGRGVLRLDVLGPVDPATYAIWGQWERHVAAPGEPVALALPAAGWVLVAPLDRREALTRRAREVFEAAGDDRWSPSVWKWDGTAYTLVGPTMPCGTCGEPVGTDDVACPHCGELTWARWTRRASWGGTAAGLALGLGLVQGGLVDLPARDVVAFAFLMGWPLGAWAARLAGASAWQATAPYLGDRLWLWCMTLASAALLPPLLAGRTGSTSWLVVGVVLATLWLAAAVMGAWGPKVLDPRVNVLAARWQR